MVEANRNPKNSSSRQENLPIRSRSPLLPSEKDNATNCRRPRVKEVTSRYLSSYSSSLSSSGTIASSSPSSVNSKRSQSVDRHRPSASKYGISSEISASKSICTTRRVSVSFQGESFVFQTSKIQNEISFRRNIVLSGRSGDFSASPEADCVTRTTSPSVISTAKSLPSLSRTIASPSIINFAAEILKRGKRGENRIEEAHSLRLLHNRHLQWRYMNARSSSLLSLQNLAVEKSLLNVWMATTQKRDSVSMKRITLHLLRRNMKLGLILKEQMVHLEEWSLIDRQHEISLCAAIEALKAAILRLPVVDGARGNVQDIKKAMGSAVDVMQSARSSLWSMLIKIEKTGYMATELLKVAAQERALLEESQGLLCKIAAMHVEQCSLRVHLQQLNRRG